MFGAFITVLIVLGILAYLGVGFAIARFYSFNAVETLPWWKIILIMLFWPLIPVLFLFAVIGWMNSGSH